MTLRGTTAVGGFVVVAMGLVIGASPNDPVGPALDRYAAGDAAVALAARPFSAHTAESAIAALDAWVGPGPDSGMSPDAMAAWTQRGRVAAQFAVDVTAQREITRAFHAVPVGDPTTQGRGYVGFEYTMPDVPSFDHDRFTAPIVVWAYAHLPKDGPLEPWEEWWWMTSIGLLQGAGEWRLLAGSRFEVGHENPKLAAWHRAVLAHVRVGHLNAAEARLGVTPRLRMARAVVASAALTDIARRFTVGGGASMAGDFVRPDVLRSLEQASRTVNSGRFTEVERQLEALLDISELEGEAALRLAQLRVIRRDWTATTRWLDRAEPLVRSDIDHATIDYFRGWVFERTGREDQALERYLAAHARFTWSPNLNTLLAAQLMRVGRRTEAGDVLEASMTLPFDLGRRDLWRILVDGDAKYAAGFAERMREAR